MNDQRLLPGSRLGPYKIIRLIGKGGMGEVYEAREELLHRSVALKIMTEEALQGIHLGVDLFIKEGKALAQLNHPHVVTIYQLGYDDGIHYIAMEYVEGPDLEEYIKNSPFDLNKRISIFHKILLGARALHRAGIIHSDLKPRNIIVQDEKKIKIVDFGIAHIMKDSQLIHSTAEFMGSVHYASPEIAKGSLPTFQSDIWSLGVIFYQLLTSQRPYSGKTRSEVLKKVCEDELTFDALNSVLVPQKLKEIVRKMCSKNLHHRYHSVDEVLQQLAEVLASGSTSRWSALAVPGLIAVIALSGAALLLHSQNKKTVSVTSTPSPTTPPTVQPTDILEPKTTEMSPELTTDQIAADTEPTTAPVSHSNSPSPLVEKVPTEPAPTPTPLAAPLKKAPIKEVHKHSKPKQLAQARLKEYQITTILGDSTIPLKRGTSSVNESPILSWHRVPDAESYEIQIALNSRFQNPLIEQRTQETRYTWSNARPGNYFWRVRALSNSRSTGTYSPTGYLKILLPKPVLSKSNFKFSISESSPSNFTIEWEGHTQARGYRVLLAKEASMTKPFRNEVLPDSRFTFKADPGKYYLQVIALTAQREPASLPSSATLIEIKREIQLQIPDLLQPINGIKVPSQGTMITPIACSWSKSQGATNYQFQLASDSEFKNIEHETQTTNTKYIITIPLSMGQFYWRVRALSGDEGKSSWSKPKTFTVN